MSLANTEFLDRRTLQHLDGRNIRCTIGPHCSKGVWNLFFVGHLRIIHVAGQPGIQMVLGKRNGWNGGHFTPGYRPPILSLEHDQVLLLRPPSFHPLLPIDALHRQFTLWIQSKGNPGE